MSEANNKRKRHLSPELEDGSAKDKKRKLHNIANNVARTNPEVRDYKKSKVEGSKAFRRGESVKFNEASRKTGRYVTKSVQGYETNKEKIRKKSADHAATVQLLLNQESRGFLEAEDSDEDTATITQSQLKELTDIQTSDNIFNLELDDSYIQQYSRNGIYSLLGGSKGNFALFDWKNNNLLTERNVEDKIHDMAILHNHQLFALAQSEYVYIYDSAGSEQHKLRSHQKPRQLEFLPYHFLLTSIGLYGNLTYHDISTGSKVSQIRTLLGDCFTMRANPTNAIIHLGSTLGRVSLWSPTVNKPLVEMLCHDSSVIDIAITDDGTLMATAGIDNIVKVFDMRTYREINSFTCRGGGSLKKIEYSQSNLLACAYGRFVEVRKDSTRAKEPVYMKHKAPSNINSINFCPFEDVLGVGHNYGFQSTVIPGSGNPSFDSLYGENPFQTKHQRREQTVKNLLQKVPYDMITLNPENIASLRPDLNDSSYIFTPNKNERQIQEEKRKEERARKTKEYREKQAKIHAKNAGIETEEQQPKEDLSFINPNSTVLQYDEGKIEMPSFEPKSKAFVKSNKKSDKFKKVSDHEKHRQHREGKEKKTKLERKPSQGKVNKSTEESIDQPKNALDRFRKQKL